MASWLINYIATVISALLCSVHANVFCHETYECINQHTNTTNDDKVHCTGYKSHYGANSSIANANTLTCSGAFSCAKVSSINSFIIECDGSLSCFNVANLQSLEIPNNTESLQAAGSGSISYTNIRAKHNDNIYCSGEQSCAYSVIDGFQDITAYGSYSLIYATIDTGDEYNLHKDHIIFLDGFYAGFEASVTCRTNHRCNINCEGAESCVNLHLNCTNNCRIWASSITTTALSLQNILFYDILTMEEENDELCSLQLNTLNFDDYEERKGNLNILENNINGGPICCRADSACMQNHINYTSYSNKSVICSGELSCSESTIYTNNGSIFCGGKSACSEANITTTEKLYCGGEKSCFNTIISQASYIYCSGRNSCGDSSIFSDGRDLNLFLTAHTSGFYAKVICATTDHCDIFCLGIFSCWSLELLCNGTCNVYCDDFHSGCPVGWPTNEYIPQTINPSNSPSAAPSIAPLFMYTSIFQTVSSVIVTIAEEEKDKNEDAYDNYDWLALAVVLGIIFIILVVVYRFYTLQKHKKAIKIMNANMYNVGQKNIKVVKNVDFMGKADNNATNNKTVQSPENINTDNERIYDTATKSMNSEGIIANTNLNINANVVLQLSSTEGVADKNVEQLPETYEGERTHPV